jgi:hypothetical protein
MVLAIPATNRYKTDGRHCGSACVLGLPVRQTSVSNLGVNGENNIKLRAAHPPLIVTGAAFTGVATWPTTREPGVGSGAAQRHASQPVDIGGRVIDATRAKCRSMPSSAMSVRNAKRCGRPIKAVRATIPRKRIPRADAILRAGTKAVDGSNSDP